MNFQGTCRTPLGIQSGAIPDSSFQASSSLDVSLGPHTARIRSTIEGGGWCPKTLIDSQSEEYLQINFFNLTVITLIETQGRQGPFQVMKIMKIFLLMISMLCFFLGRLC
jgi:hypothetical protein